MMNQIGGNEEKFGMKILNNIIVKDRNFSPKKFTAHRKNYFFCALKISFKRFCWFPNKSMTKWSNINVVDYSGVKNGNTL